MIDLPTKAKVNCSDGHVGHSTYVIFNPKNHQMTNLVVKNEIPPFGEYLVPVDQVEETTNDLITLKCTRKDFSEMELFECEEYIKTRLPEYMVSDQFNSLFGVDTREVDTYIPVKILNISSDEIALRHGAQVEATDGSVGQVDELLINSKNMQVTHFVLLEKHMAQHREITIPVSQIVRVFDDKVYLKLDRQSVEQLPTTPIQRWPQDESEKMRLE